MDNNQQMPSVGGHTTMLVFGFVFGVLWGFLALSPYKKMRAAIDAGDAVAAWDNAKKVKMFFFIGLGVNVLILILRVLGNA